MTMTENQPNEKRRFSRVPFEADVVLTQGETQWQAQLLDISLNGILIKRPENWTATLDEQFALELIFADGSSLITGEVSVAHTEEKHIGFRMVNIDIESVTHLRRLIELNLGEPELMDRELSALHWK